MENIDYTQDYNEMVIQKNFGDPVERKRLRLANGPGGFGFRVFDRKTKQYIYHTPTREKAIQCIEALREGKEAPSTEGDVFSPKILILEEKHFTSHIIIPNVEKLKEICLQIVKSRQNYFFKPEKPIAEGFDPKITKEQLDSMPQKYKLQSQKDISEYNKKVKQYNSDIREYRIFEQALNGNGAAAYEVCRERSGYQYEGFELIDPATEYHG